MNNLDLFNVSSVLMIAAGAGFIGSGCGIAIAAHRRPSPRSARNSTLVSTLVGVAFICVAIWRGLPWAMQQ